jgi:hypothetical protein
VLKYDARLHHADRCCLMIWVPSTIYLI